MRNTQALHTQRFACLCLPRAGIQGMCANTPDRFSHFYEMFMLVSLGLLMVFWLIYIYKKVSVFWRPVVRTVIMTSLPCLSDFHDGFKCCGTRSLRLLRWLFWDGILARCSRLICDLQSFVRSVKRLRHTETFKSLRGSVGAIRSWKRAGWGPEYFVTWLTLLKDKKF